MVSRSDGALTTPETQRAFSVTVGPVSLDIVLRGATDAGAEAWIANRLGPFVPGKGGARTIHCDWTVTDPGWQEFPGTETAREPVATRLSPSCWYAQWCYYRMMFADDRSAGLLSDRETALGHAIRGAAVFGTMPHEALYFHAATLVYDGEAILIAGSPNAGKSTISREGRPDRVLCNEISIVERRPDGWWALPSPFWGSTDRAEYTPPAPLKAVAVLGRDDERNRWRRLGGGAALSALTPHVGCQAAAQFSDPDLLRALAELTRDLPTYDFRWHRPSHPMAESPWNP